MAKFIKGDVVVVPFPFSDLTQAKRPPALVIEELEGDVLFSIREALLLQKSLMKLLKRELKL